MKHEAVPLVELQRLDESDIHELRAVERAVGRLFDQEDPVVDLLAHQEGMQILEEDRQVLFAVAKGNDDSDSVTSATIRRLEASAERDFIGESLFDVLEKLGLRVDLDRPDKIRWRGRALVESEHLHDAAQDAFVLHETRVKVLVLGLLHRLLVLDLVMHHRRRYSQHLNYTLASAIPYFYCFITKFTIKFNITIFTMKIFGAERF